MALNRPARLPISSSFSGSRARDRSPLDTASMASISRRSGVTTPEASSRYTTTPKASTPASSSGSNRQAVCITSWSM